MLYRIPSIFPKGLTAYFDSIDSKITDYEMSEAPMLLEQAIRHSSITELFDTNKDSIIALNVLSFL